MVLCANCRQHHPTAGDVKACHEVAGVFNRPPGNAPIKSTGSGTGRRSWRQFKAMPSTFEPESPAVVYLISHPELGSLKIGVTAGGRVDDHRAQGWDLISSWWFRVGYDALEIEELVLDRWRNLFSQPPVVASAQMPQGGASETAIDSVSARRDTIEFVDRFSSGTQRGCGAGLE